MAQVVAPATTRRRIDLYLGYLLDQWRQIPSVAAEWDTWEDYEQLDFVIEWPIREDRLIQLRHWHEQGLLSIEQRSRYADLLGLIDRHRPTLERLLAE
jgi:hypothetical protein